MGSRRQNWRCARCRDSKETTKTAGGAVLPADKGADILDILTSLRADFNKILGEFQEFRAAMESNRGSIELLNEKTSRIEAKLLLVDDLEARVRANEETLSVLGNKLEAGCAAGGECGRMAERLEKLEYSVRRCNVEVQNVPYSKSENLLNITEALSTKIGITWDERAVVKVHRVARGAGDRASSSTMDIKRPKNIIIHFNNEAARDAFLRAGRSRRDLLAEDVGIEGDKQRIFISEHLTPFKKKLFRDARALRKSKGYRFIWIRHGTIYMRKDSDGAVVVISSQADLNKIV
jgi:hypothetical protein